MGILKGVILGICREARLVDLTHEVAPHDILEGQLALESAWRYFPEGTVHLAVVDPGVGGGRRALALSAGGQRFVGPDNGLFTFAVGGDGWSAVSIEAPAYRLPAVSQTFHGRDVFAPAAAHLAAGLPLERLGPPILDPVRVALPGCRIGDGELVGEVIRSDRFGNLLTSVPADGVLALAARGGQILVEVGGRPVGPLRESYGAGSAQAPAAILGSAGRLELFVREGSAAALTGAVPGTRVRVRVDSTGR